MKVITDGRLPSVWSVPAVAQLFREIAKAIGLLDDVGLTTKGTVIVDNATKGIVLKDTQATPHYWRVTVSNVGVLTTTDLGTTRP